MDCCRCCGKCPRFWASCTAISGIISLLIAIWLTSLYNRLTPIYQDISCTFGAAKLEHLQIGVPLISPTKFSIEIEMKCSNPNPYTISFDYSKKGGVYMGSSKTKVGDSMESPFSNSGFPAESNGSIFATTDVTINGGVLSSITGELIGSTGVPLYIELNQKLGVDIRFFFGGHFKVQQDFVKDCGMMLSGLMGVIGTGKIQQGRMACADSFAQLEVPPLDGSSGGSGAGDMHFAADDMDPETIKRGRVAKDVGLGVAMGVTYGSALILLVTSAYLLRSICVSSYSNDSKFVQTEEDSESCMSEPESMPE